MNKREERARRIREFLRAEGHPTDATPPSGDSGVAPPTSVAPTCGPVQDVGFDEAGILRRVGKYKVVREIASGGMGVVYEAMDEALGRHVALKTIRSGELTPPDLVVRLHREAAIAARLLHPNIVGVHEVGTVAMPGGSDLHFIVMDYVVGTTLAHVLEGSTPREELLRIFHDVCGAVGFAHRQGVTHRDLKPSNVLLDQNARVVLADFGLARREEAMHDLTQSHAVMGTPHYMSPEQVDGRMRDADARTDVYSLGVILYQILCGRLPFQGDTLGALYNAILLHDPPPPLRVRQGIEPDLQVICLKCLEKDPSRRYATAAELAEDVRRFRWDLPILAHPPTRLYQLRRFVARRRGVLGVATIVAAVVAIIAWSWAVRTGSEESFRRAVAEARRAFARGDWSRASIEAAHGLEIRADSELQGIWRDARARIEEMNSESRAASIARELLAPVEALIQETRPFFYVRGEDIQARISTLVSALEGLERDAGADHVLDRQEVSRTLGTGWYLAGDVRRAQGALEKADPSAHDDPIVSYYLGRIALERSMATLLRGGCESMEEKRRQAKEWGTRGLAYMSRPAVGWVGAKEVDKDVAAAYVALANDQAAELVVRCEKGIERFGSSPGTEEYWNLKGWVCKGKERIDAYSRAIEIRPHYPWALFMRGVAREDCGEREEAIGDYSAALRINGRFAEAYASRGNAYLLRKQAEEAVRDQSRALDIDSSYAFAHFSRGNAWIARGDSVQAIQDYDSAISLIPTYAEALVGRSDARRLQGERGLALADLKRALDVCSPQWPLRAAVQRKAAELESLPSTPQR